MYSVTTKAIGNIFAATVLFLCVSLNSFADNAPHTRAFRMVYNDGRPPYFYTEQGKPKGIWVIILNEAGKRIALDVTHEGYPWARAQAMVRSGQADAMLTIATDERLTYALDAGYVTTLPGQTYTWAGNPQMAELNNIRSWNDLKRYSVVSYLGNGILKTNLGDANIAWQTSEVAALKVLALRRYDLTVDNPVMVDRAINAVGLQDKLVPVGPKLPGFEYKLLISKQSQYANRAEQFAKTLDAMQRDGTIAKIIKENGG